MLLLSFCTHFIYVHEQGTKYSNDILVQWERVKRTVVTSKTLKRKELEEAVTSCGLSPAKISVVHLRILLASLRKHRLPMCAKTVDFELVNTHGENISRTYSQHTQPHVNTMLFVMFVVYTHLCIVGPDLRSYQQRARRLLEILDSTLATKLGKKKLQTGDYQWNEAMMKDMIDVIEAEVRAWVPDSDSPPCGYDESQSKDLWLWAVRRKTGLSWVKSVAAHEFAKQLYKVHTEIFTSVLKPQDHTTINKCLDQYYYQRIIAEAGVIRDQLRELLTLISADCAVDGDVVDCFSFVTRPILRAVFRFFASQVRVCPLKSTLTQRFKDREDMVSRGVDKSHTNLWFNIVFACRPKHITYAVVCIILSTA